MSNQSATSDKNASSMENDPYPSPTMSPSSAPTVILSDLLAQTSFVTHASLEDPSSPQSRAFEWLSQHPKLGEMETWHKVQLFAIVTFYFTFHGSTLPRGNIINTWLDYTTSECYWAMGPSWATTALEHGEVGRGLTAVVCDDETGRITKISTTPGFDYGRIIQATIPPEVGLLTDLVALNLDEFALDSSLADFFPPNCTIVPPSFLLASNDPSAEMLNSTPTSFPAYPQTLREIRIYSEASIEGPLPTSLGCLNNLALLHISSASGQLPTEIGLMTSLLELFMIDEYRGNLGTNTTSSSNPYGSTLPSEIGQLTQMTLLQLHHGLRGTIPTEIGRLTHLEHLEVVYSWTSAE
jgi:hypothetical protein